MQTESHDMQGGDRNHAEQAGQVPDLFPFMALAPLAGEILANANMLPDAELMRIAGSLRSLADEVMAVVDRRLGSRPGPRLVIDNTRR
jgi:hypothetical protein